MPNPPRKPRVAKEGETRTIPPDQDILDAISQYRHFEHEYRLAYKAMMASREHLVAVLRAAGVVGFSSL